MDRATLLHTITVCGDQKLASADRWKSIKYIAFSSMGCISDFGTKVSNDEVMFVDKQITDGGTTSQLTGFYILEHLSVDSDFIGRSKHITFVPYDAITVITFNNTNITTNQPIYTNLTSFKTATGL